MSLEADIKLGSLERGRFRYFPVVPGRLEFAMALRRLLLSEAEKPPIVAVELPGFLGQSYARAIQRMPEMSVILYTAESGDDDDHAIYVPVEPADPFTEALRTAEEIGTEVIFLEPDTQERPHLHDACPDTYAIQRIGLEEVQSRRIESGRSSAPRKLQRTPRRWRGNCKARIPTRGCW